MIRAFFLALGQLGDPAIRRVLAKTLLLTLALLAMVGGAVWYGLRQLLAELTSSGTSSIVAGIAAVPVTIALGWLGFRAIAMGVIQLFGDEVVIAVERRHYPAALANARHVPMGTSVLIGLGSAARAVVVNILVTPLYLVLLVTGVGTILLFVAVNAWLLGHDLTELVGVRHLDRRSLRSWKRSTAGKRFLLGLIVSALLLIPFVNLLAPVIGAAMATHLFHARRAP